MVNKLYRFLKRKVFQFIKVDTVTHLRFRTTCKLLNLGEGYYGSRIIPDNVINKDSVCYCAGCGEDVSFDIGLIDRYGCDVYSFDPTPRSIQYVRKYYGKVEKYHFFDYGVGGKDEIVRFYAPKNSNNVSYSIANPYMTEEYFDAEVKSISTVMSDNGHDRIDLLKLNIEGAEYGVLDEVFAKGIDVKIYSVDFHGDKERIIDYIQKIVVRGYDFVYARAGTEYTFVKRDILS